MKKNKSTHIRLDRVMALSILGLHAAILFVLSPLYSVCHANTLVPDLVLYIIDGATYFLDFGIMVVGFTIISAAFFMNLDKKLKYPLIYLGASLFRRLAAIGMAFLIYGSVYLEDIYINLTVFVLDVAVLTIATLIINIFSKRHLRKAALQQKASLLFNNDVASKNTEALYPFKKLFSKDNPLQDCLLAIGILLSSTKLISRTMDLIDTLSNAVGSMSAGIITFTVGGYVTDVLLAVLSYALSCFLLSSLYSRNERKLAMNKLYDENKK